LPIGYLFANVVLFQVFYYWRFSNLKNRPRMFVGNKYVGWAGVFTLFYIYSMSNLDEKITDVVLYYNMDATIRNIMIAGYLVTQTYKSKGLLVAFRPKIE
jgi:hypothetical protein